MTRRVLITAGASGIGLAIAEKFLETGARVHVCDIDGAAVEKIRDKHKDLSASVCDVADADQVKAMANEAMGAMDGLDVLVNNAGIGGGDALLENTDEEMWRRTMDVNLSGAFYCLKACVPHFKDQQSGAVINISTVSVKTALPGRAPYIASKQGLMGLTHNAARELGPFNVRCNAILPGLIKGPRAIRIVEGKAKDWNVSYEEAEERYLRYVSMRCWIEAAEVGDLAVFLASDKARHITGQFIAVDGNMEWEA